MAKKDIVKKRKNEVIKEAKIEGINRDDPKYETTFKIILSVAVLLLVIIGGVFWYLDGNKNDTKDTDSVKFKTEYEEYNDQKNSLGKDYLQVSISDQNVIKYSTYDEVFEILEGKTGVIYFGFPTCPWCRNLVPVLLDAADEVGIDTIYYLNAVEERDKKYLDEDGEIVVEKEGTEEYYELVEKLDSVLGEYEGLNDSSIKRLYFPTVVFVKDGKIVGSHIGTVDSQTDPSIALTDEQYEELKSLLAKNMTKLISCDGAC